MDAASGLNARNAGFVSSNPVARLGADWSAGLALLAVGWLLALNQQRLEWTVNPTYAYGWVVPLLAGYLFLERWKTRPRSVGPSARAWLVFPALLLACYLPIRVIQEANPDWVKINWSMAAVMIGLSFSAVYSLSGWRGVRHCAFPLLFMLTALPWPVWMEDTLTKSLMQWNASAAAEVLTLAGFPALAKGNLILIGSSWVNVEEACSGIRSLQTAFMVSLFFGEFHRLGWGLRGWLMVASFGVAFAVNFGRTVTLTYLTGVGGNAMAEEWHDFVGNATMVLCLAALWLLAEVFRRRQPATAAIPPARARRPSRAPFPVWFALGGLAWLGTSEIATAAWYGHHERGAPPPIAWSIAWPAAVAGYQEDELGERSRALLKFNEGRLASWPTPDGHRWQMYYLRWLPGRVSKFLAGSHYPTVCLPATGLRLVAETGTFVCHVGPLALPFVSYLFDDNGRDVYVFHAIVEEGASGAGKPADYRQAKSMERVESALRGERNLGQRVLGVAISGPVSSEEAQAALQATLMDIVRFGEPARITPP